MRSSYRVSPVNTACGTTPGEVRGIGREGGERGGNGEGGRGGGRWKKEGGGIKVGKSN